MPKPAKVGLRGKTPAVKINPIDPNKPRRQKKLSEVEKYTKMWTVPDYRKTAPGELAANTFLSVAKPKAGSKVIDFGCGTGRGGLMLMFMGNMDVKMLDFAANCLDDDLVTAVNNENLNIEFEQHDLTQPYGGEPSEYGYCTDVMEHIPPEELDVVLDNILAASRKVFFRISTTLDMMGPKYLKQHLHLSVHDYAWWAKKLLEHDAIILHSEDLGGAVDFYVTGWSKDLPKNPKINTDSKKILSNIKENASRGTRHVRPHMKNEQEIMILAGGPSLNEFESEIIQNHKDGMRVITVNGAYNWALDRGITNVNQCMIDAREFNRRFVDPPRNDCNYFIASQCDPSVFDGLPPERTYMWQVTTSPEAIDLVDSEYPEYIMSGGGSTVTLRAIVLMRLLGFYKQHIYGFDSCLMGDKHHAYEQKENDYKVTNVPVTVGGKTFICQPWMAYQAYEFIDMCKALNDEIMFDIKGDGLIAHIIKTGAEMPELEET